MKEKLIKLLAGNAQCNGVLGIEDCYTCPHRYEEDCYTHALAEHLIANGVTVQEWISVKDRFPENNTRVVVCYNCPIDGKKTSSSDVMWKGHFVRYGDNVTHWMPLPEPPKGE